MIVKIPLRCLRCFTDFVHDRQDLKSQESADAYTIYIRRNVKYCPKCEPDRRRILAPQEILFLQIHPVSIDPTSSELPRGTFKLVFFGPTFRMRHAIKKLGYEWEEPEPTSDNLLSTAGSKGEYRKYIDIEDIVREVEAAQRIYATVCYPPPPEQIADANAIRKKLRATQVEREAAYENELDLLENPQAPDILPDVMRRTAGRRGEWHGNTLHIGYRRIEFPREEADVLKEYKAKLTNYKQQRLALKRKYGIP